MEKKTAESNLFSFFLKLHPGFTGSKIVDWFQPADDPPDIICRTEVGESVAVELSGWLDERQIQSARQREQIEQQILDALGELHRTRPKTSSVSGCTRMKEST